MASWPVRWWTCRRVGPDGASATWDVSTDRPPEVWLKGGMWVEKRLRREVRSLNGVFPGPVGNTPSPSRTARTQAVGAMRIE